jgi:hypothetical protein
MRWVKGICVLGLIIVAVCPAVFAQAAANEKEAKSTAADRISLGLTVYNSGFALVRDARKLNLQKGQNRLAYVDTAGKIMPQTALLHGQGFTVLEQNFDYDLLTLDSLLKKHIGRQVGLARTHPTSGEDKIESGRLLSAADGKAIIRLGDRIEVVGVRTPYRFIFSDVPSDLRERPTLSMLIQAQKPGPHPAELSYMTKGLNWSADYVGTLDAKEEQLDLKGWVTLANQSGTSYAQATLQLMAGDVRRVLRERSKTLTKRPQPLAAAPAPPQREKLFEYHLYTLSRPVDIADRQSKQVELLNAVQIPVQKQYVIDSSFNRYRSRPGSDIQSLKVNVSLGFANRKPHLGQPLPAGVVRLHKRDSRGALQFIGEDRIGHTPEGRPLKLFLGSAFDLTATRKLTDYKKVYGNERELAWCIVVHSAKEIPVRVKVAERIPGHWKILSESHPHTRDSARLAVWMLEVPAKGKVQLDYRVHVK